MNGRTLHPPAWTRGWSLGEMVKSFGNLEKDYSHYVLL
jgi:hypothetical protein